MKKQLPRSPWLTAGLLLAVGLVFSGISLALSHRGEISWGGDPLLFVLNTLPVLLALAVLWLAFGQAWLSVLVTGTLLFLMTGGNYFKVLLRDDPLVWSDLHRLREGFMMGGEFDITFTPLMDLWIGLIIASAVLLFFLGRGKPSATPRLLALTAAGMALLIFFYEFCPDNERFAYLAGEHATDEREAYAACGLVYPFLHSAGGSMENYDLAAGRSILAQYTDADIPEEKKVNIISIQLEANADLTTMGVEGITDNVYAPFYQLLEKSYSGTLVTDIFAGGTTETEWAVLTGGNNHDDFTYKTDSVAWYLKSQGYNATGAHPCREWFYDRVHVNPNLGLDNYLFTDNYYFWFVGEDDVAYDNIFFPDLEQRLAEYFDAYDTPLFSFNVTYQGHGPYRTDQADWGEGCFDGDYSRELYYAMNTYCHLVLDTYNWTLAFTDFLEQREEPIVLLLFGDHKPWMGNNGVFYDEMGVNLDRTTEEGFLNYYTTWYTIWANSAAKEVLGNDFVGEGPMLSPCFLMNELFELCGWEGPAYMQAQRETAHTLPVLHTIGWAMENGVLTATPSEQAQAMMETFQDVSAYDRVRYKP